MASLIGLFTALSDSTRLLQSTFLASVYKTAVSLLTEDRLQAIYKATVMNESTSSRLPVYVDQYYDGVTLVTDLFNFLQEFLSTFLTIEGYQGQKMEDVWGLSATTRSSSNIIDEEMREMIRRLYEMSWQHTWRQNVKPWNDEMDSEVSDAMMPPAVKCAVYCALHVSGMEDDLVTRLASILNDPDAMFMEHLRIDIYLTCLEALGILAVNFPDTRSKVVAIIIQFLVEPSSVFLSNSDENTSSVLRQCASNVLHNCLKAYYNPTVVRTTLYNLIRVLQTGHPSEMVAAKSTACQNAISAIASITPVLKAKEVVEVAIPALTRRLEDGIFDDLIWESLGNIGLTCDIDVFREIISFILDYSKHAFTRISKVSHTLARMTNRPTAFAMLYFETILSFFVEKAAGLQRSPDPALLLELRDMATIMKILCDQEDFPREVQSNEEMILQFRNFWLYAVMFVLGPNGTWPKEWRNALSSIASRTPPLILAKKKRSLEADLGANSIMRTKFSDQVVVRTRSLLAQCLPSKAADIRITSFPQCAYLLAVHHLESFRIRKSGTDAILRYITDERLYNSDVYHIIETLADEILVILRKDRLTNRDHDAIVDHTRSLLLQAACRLERVRKFAARNINTILAQFPSVLWNHRAAYFMIDVLQCFDIRYQSDAHRKACFDLAYVDHSDIKAASKDYFDLCAGWMNQAIKRSSSETLGLLQGYMVDLHTNFPELTLGDRSDLISLLGRFCSHDEIASSIIKSLSNQALYFGEIKGMLLAMSTGDPDLALYHRIAQKLTSDMRLVVAHSNQPDFISKLHPIMYRAAALVLLSQQVQEELLHLICWTPILVFNPAVMEMAVSVWTWIAAARPELHVRILADLVAVWETTSRTRKGLYQEDTQSMNPFMSKMTYTPSQKPSAISDPAKAHLIWIRYLLDRFKSARLQSRDHVKLYVKLYQTAHMHVRSLSTKWANREAHFALLILGARIAEQMDLENDPAALFAWTAVVYDALKWFDVPPMFGNLEKGEIELIVSFYDIIKAHRPEKTIGIACSSPMKSAMLAAGPAGRVELNDAQQLLLLLLENELSRLTPWMNPLDDKSQNLPTPPVHQVGTIKWSTMVRTAWSVNPAVALQLTSRFVGAADAINVELAELSLLSSASVMNNPEGLSVILRHAGKASADDQLRTLLYWAPVPPITAISLLGQQYKMHPWILQYAVRVLEYFPIEQVFFYIPQMVQALRYDTVGYIEHFVLYAAKTSQLFAHQIIWNMNANMYKFNKEGAVEMPDDLKSVLDRIQEKIVSGLSGSDKEFYIREFGFFDEVTGISGKLKPLVEASATKAEKKKKIDEEIRKIKVEVGVYLPTNPESIVVDIDYDSGRPLQSHAKAPFMATFKVRDADEKQAQVPALNTIASLDGTSTRWMASIFKVGDDCRQDVLALQLISIFKSIFHKAGLDLYVFPYRVVATAPGCGVIEVIPRSMSRDMMGREKVNSLYDWFIAEFGTEDSVEFRNARYEFVKSLAAYSLVLFILQIKDRHNGNIMLDKEGHLVHIDFGFMLSIAPGGGILEVSPFKLTAEMVQVMGGDVNSPSYRLFSELCVKAYLAARPYAEEVIQMVQLMMDSGLPCFKGEITTRRLRERFQLDKSERQAAEFMLGCIRSSHENTRSGLYDRFQYLQNGIPY
ncbi:phosphatidylinositol-4- kinase [Borealophlyctis nickersoniae]|nr:phosphatidylinositol-4- kinase [Borealophlyctis nickersoniae]